MNGMTEKNQLALPNQKTEHRLTKRKDGYLDVIREKPIRVTVKVLVPVKKYPKFNFIGKLLGPKGNSLKRLQEQTTTKMAVLGRGSMRNSSKEEELRLSGDMKYEHLKEDLHVEISAFASPAEAYASIAYALTEIRPYLYPDDNDSIRKCQIREMECMSENGESTQETPTPQQHPPVISATKIPNMPIFLSEDSRPVDDISECYVPPRQHSPLPHPTPLPLRRKLLPVKVEASRKRRVLSILDRAKMALDRSYGIHSRNPCDEYHLISDELNSESYASRSYERRHHCWNSRDALRPSIDRHHRRFDPYPRPALS